MKFKNKFQFYSLNESKYQIQIDQSGRSGRETVDKEKNIFSTGQGLDVSLELEHAHTFQNISLRFSYKAIKSLILMVLRLYHF